MNDDNFFSVDKLVEFGMGMAIAQQMIKTMNEAMTNMKTPGTFPNFAPLKVAKFFVLIDGDQQGPLSESEMMKLILDKKISKQNYIWQPGMPNWEYAEKIEEINRMFNMVPPPIPKQE